MNFSSTLKINNDLLILPNDDNWNNKALATFQILRSLRLMNGKEDLYLQASYVGESSVRMNLSS